MKACLATTLRTVYLLHVAFMVAPGSPRTRYSCWTRGGAGPAGRGEVGYKCQISDWPRHKLICGKKLTLETARTSPVPTLAMTQNNHFETQSPPSTSTSTRETASTFTSVPPKLDRTRPHCPNRPPEPTPRRRLLRRQARPAKRTRSVFGFSLSRTPSALGDAIRKDAFGTGNGTAALCETVLRLGLGASFIGVARPPEENSLSGNLGPT